MSPTVRWDACQRRCRHCRPLERPHSDCCLASLRRAIASHRRSSPLPGFFSIRPLIRSGPPRCLIAPARCSCRGRGAGPVRYVEGAAPPVPGRAVAAADGFRAAASTSWCCCCSGTAVDPIPLSFAYCCWSSTAAGQVLLSFRISPLALRLSAGPVGPAVPRNCRPHGLRRYDRPLTLPHRFRHFAFASPRVTSRSAASYVCCFLRLPVRHVLRQLLRRIPAVSATSWLYVAAPRRRSASVPRHRAVRAPVHRTAPHGRPAAVRRGRVP